MSEEVGKESVEKLSETATKTATCKCPHLLCNCEHQPADEGSETASSLPVAAIKAAADALVHHPLDLPQIGPEGERVWLSDSAIGRADDIARDAIEAAYPAIRQQVAEEIAVALANAGDERSPCRHHRNEEKSDHDSTRYAAYLDAASLAREIGAKA